MKNSLNRSSVEHEEKWREMAFEMPALRFNQEWMVEIIPPFGGAMARFIAKKNGNSVSVYADFCDSLGCVGNPYWEIYPDAEGDISRFMINDTESLMIAIGKTLDETNPPPATS